MNRNHTTTLAAVLVTVAALVVAPAAATAPAGTAVTYDVQETPSPDGNASVSPGERLSGVVGVQEAELEGEVAERTYGVRVALANTDSAKADVVAETLGDVEQRLQDLEQREQTLRQARANGSVGEGEFRARMAVVAAETATAERLANASERTTERLPGAVLAENGIDIDAIRTLKDRADELTGPEVAEIARSVAGKDAGKPVSEGQGPSDVSDQVPDESGTEPTPTETGDGNRP